jgi:hypothetical protein
VQGHKKVVQGHKKVVQGHKKVVQGHKKVVQGHKKVVARILREFEILFITHSFHLRLFPKGIYVYRTTTQAFFQNPKGIICKIVR